VTNLAKDLENVDHLLQVIAGPKNDDKHID